MYCGMCGKKASLALAAILLATMAAACGKSEQPNAQLQSVKQQQSQEQEPGKLKNIEARIEDLIGALGGPSVKMEGTKGGQGGQQGSQQQSSQQGSQKGSQQASQQGGQQGSQQSGQQGTKQSGQQQGSQQQGSQQGSQQGTKQGGQQQSTKQQGSQKQPQQNKSSQQQSPQQMEKAKWDAIGMTISNLHYQWNEFMPEIAKKGADMKLVDNFDNALNNLTKTAVSKDTEKTLMAANTLYSYIPDIYSLYRVRMSPESKRMIYYTRSIILEALKDNWDQVKKDNDNLGKSWALFRNTLEKEQQQTGDRLNFSIYELKKVSDSKDKHLTDIKGRIALSNISELEKSFEQKKQ